MMMTLEQVQTALHDRNLKAVSAGCGLAYDTVWRIANGKIERVSYDAVKALSDYLQNGAVTHG